MKKTNLITKDDFSQAGVLSSEIKNYAVSQMLTMMEWGTRQIESFVDSSLLNPELDYVISTKSLTSESELFNGIDTMTIYPLEDISIQTQKLRRRKGIKKKIKQVICEIADTISKLDNLAEIISTVLLALIAAFGGGIGALLLPVVVALIVKFIKNGKENFCE